jgi:lysophospholipase L1-like esterase
MRSQKKRFAVLCWLTALFIGMAGCALQPDSHTANAKRHWLTTWGTSAVDPTPNGQAFENQTLRLIVHPSVAGEQVRVRIANSFGARPLDVGAAGIALQESGAAIVTGSNRPLTFGGRAATIVPPGAVIVSDPVTLQIPPSRNLAVSIFLPKSTGPATAHPGANQTSFVSAAGNFVAGDAAVYATKLSTWPYLVGVEIQANDDARAIVTFGDSITDGFKSTIDANRRWPDLFAERLRAAGRKESVVNQGISGNRILHDFGMGQPRFGPNALSRFDRDVLTVSGASHVVILIGINDIGMGSASRSPEEAVSADDIIAGLKQLVVRAHAQELKVIGATLTPFGQAAYFTEEGEKKRQAVNEWIRGSKDYDGTIDFDRATRDPAKPTQLLPAYDSGDHLHPNDAGYKAMADSVDLTLFN